MDIFHYSALTREYLGRDTADPDPLTPGNWLIPANATTTPPPANCTQGYALCFDGEKWVEVIDQRGTRYWLGKDEHTIQQLGETVPDGASRVEPPKDPDVPTPADVDEERDRRVQDGLVVDLTSGAQVFVQRGPKHDGNLADLKLLADELDAAGTTTPDIPFRDGNNVVHQLTPQEVKAMFLEVTQRKTAIYAAAWAIKDDPNGISEDFANDPRWP